MSHGTSSRLTGMQACGSAVLNVIAVNSVSPCQGGNVGATGHTGSDRWASRPKAGINTAPTVLAAWPLCEGEGARGLVVRCFANVTSVDEIVEPLIGVLTAAVTM
jgi:hypothetical protein